MKLPEVTFNSIQEAETERARLLVEIQGIDAQLGDTPMGSVSPRSPYHAWRRRALAAKAHLAAEFQVVKLWMKQHRVASPSGKTPFVLVRDAAELLRRLQGDGVDLDELEVRLVVELEEYAMQVREEGLTT